MMFAIIVGLVCYVVCCSPPQATTIFQDRTLSASDDRIRARHCEQASAEHGSWGFAYSTVGSDITTSYTTRVPTLHQVTEQCVLLFNVICRLSLNDDALTPNKLAPKPTPETPPSTASKSSCSGPLHDDDFDHNDDHTDSNPDPDGDVMSPPTAAKPQASCHHASDSEVDMDDSGYPTIFGAHSRESSVGDTLWYPSGDEHVLEAESDSEIPHPRTASRKKQVKRARKQDLCFTSCMSVLQCGGTVTGGTTTTRGIVAEGTTTTILLPGALLPGALLPGALVPRALIPRAPLLPILLPGALLPFFVLPGALITQATTTTTNNIFVTGDMPVRGAHSASQGQVQSHRDGQLRCQVHVCRCEEFTRVVRPPDVQHFGVKPPMPAVCQSLREREKREGAFFSLQL